MSLDHHETAETVVTELPDVPASVTASGSKDHYFVVPGSQIYGSFWIGDIEFALQVSFIQEVVNEPESYTPVPLSPPHMAGLFSLRGTIIPVIDLRVLLEVDDAGDVGARKIAIIESGDLAMGLLFDDTGGILNSEGAARVKFTSNSEGEKDVVVDGVLKLDDGKRMVQVLNPYELLKIKRIPRVARSEGGKKSETETGGLGKRVNCISFQLGHTHCAIDLRHVQEITDVPELQHSQLAHGHILGNIDLRGRTMPVIDFRGLMGNEAPHKFSKDSLVNRKLLILKLEEGHVALLVYSIDSIIPYFESEVLPFANVALPRHDIIAGCLVNDRKDIVILLDHVQLMKDQAIVSAAQSCKEIYPSKSNERTTSKSTGSNVVNRSTFIAFTVERNFALDISYVSEIIGFPDKVLTPPYALNFVEGILNLRGELITLIDPRKLYGLPTDGAPCTKVLIFQKDGKKYGMVVESVDEIVHSIKGEFLDVPSIRNEEHTRTVSEDVIGCISIPSRGPDSDPVMVLNVTSLLERCVEAGTPQS